MLPRIFVKFQSVFVGIMIGFSIASVFVLWINQARYLTGMTVLSPQAGGTPIVDTLLTENSERTLHQAVSSNKDKNEERKSNDEQDPQKMLLHNAYKHVKTILFFIGYPRSRHSLLGSLLDAHPHMVVSDETMAFPRWRRNPKQWINGSIYAFYDSLFGASKQSTMTGRRSRLFEGSVANKNSAYGYSVPNQWQGNYDRYIEVIGDKSGAFTAGAMLQEDAIDAVHLLEKASGATVKFVHVVRNPFDNLATMTLEHITIKKRNGEHDSKVIAPQTLDDQIARYFHWAAGCNKTREVLPGKVIDIPSMKLVKEPAEILRRICAFLEITCSEDYIQDCANTVDPVPSITRDYVEWTEKQKKRVYDQMKQFSFFDSFSYDQ